MHRSLKSRKTL